MIQGEPWICSNNQSGYVGKGYLTGPWDPSQPTLPAVYLAGQTFYQILAQNPAITAATNVNNGLGVLWDSRLYKVFAQSNTNNIWAVGSTPLNTTGPAMQLQTISEQWAQLVISPNIPQFFFPGAMSVILELPGFGMCWVLGNVSTGVTYIIPVNDPGAAFTISTGGLVINFGVASGLGGASSIPGLNAILVKSFPTWPGFSYQRVTGVFPDPIGVLGTIENLVIDEGPFVGNDSYAINATRFGFLLGINSFGEGPYMLMSPDATKHWAIQPTGSFTNGPFDEDLPSMDHVGNLYVGSTDGRVFSGFMNLGAVASPIAYPNPLFPTKLQPVSLCKI